MAGLSRHNELKQEDRDHLRKLTDQLNQLWLKGQGANLGSLVGGIRPALRPVFLAELIKADLTLRYRKGRPLLLEDYCLQFPDVFTTKTLPIDLIVEEYQLRKEHGEATTLDAYKKRFPDQYARLEVALESLPPGTMRVDDEATPPPPAAKTAPQPPAPKTAPQPPTALPSPPTVRTVPPLPQEGLTDFPMTQAPGPIPPPPDNLEEREMSGHYRMLERLGSGEFGEVWKALAPGGVPVAIKRIYRPISDHASQRERQSLELIKSLRHPFLLQVQAYWIEKGGQLHVVMDLADGSLNDWCKAYTDQNLPGIPRPQLLPFFREAAEALDYLHANQVIHRDVKPANLLYLNGHAKVADFGLARLIQGDETEGTLCGTPRYMPPEAWDAQVSVNLDQYSLARTYMDVAVVQKIKRKMDIAALRREHLECNFDFTGFSKDEERVLRKALSPDPAKRYASCSDFVRALIEANEPKAEDERRVPWVPLVMALVGLFLVAVVCWQLLPPPVTPPVAEVKWRLPEGFEPNAGDELPQEVQFQGLAGVEPVVFRRVTPQKEGQPPAFYVSRYPITREQYLAALDQAEMRKRMEAWRQKMNWAVRDWFAQPPAAEVAVCWAALRDKEKARLPATNLTALEAHCFAELLGGKLPSVDQWDKAGGGLDGALAPCKPGWKPGQRPRPVGTAAGDVSDFDVCDMASGGLEFTSTLYLPSPPAWPGGLAGGKNDSHALTLRGVGYGSRAGYDFTMRADPEVLEYWRPKDDVGFRVVVEPR